MDTNISTQSDACVEAVPYNGEICTDMLMSVQVCFSGFLSSSPPPLNIPATTDQQQAETDAILVLNGLRFLNPSPECSASARQFLCLHTFRLCDTSGNFHMAPRGECFRLRDDVCFEEWSLAESLWSMPVCEDLPDASEECIGKTKSLVSRSKVPKS